MATTKKKNTAPKKKSRKYMKKAARRTIAALLMITALIVAAIPATPSRAATKTGEATSEDTTNNYIYKYDLDDELNATFSGFDKAAEGSPSGTINIPETVYYDGSNPSWSAPSGNYTVKYVAANIDVGTGLNKEDIQSINIPTSVEELGASTFKDYTGLTSVYCDGVKDLGNEVFSGCTSLSNFQGNSVTKIGDKAFLDCENMGTCMLSSYLETIGNNAFENCTSLAGLPGGVQYIKYYGEAAFRGCTNLGSSITVLGPQGSDVLTLSKSVFEGCTNITSVDFAINVAVISDDDFKGCTSLQNITFPSGLTKISGSAFEGCGSISGAIEIPGGVSVLEAGTFADSPGIPYITLNNNGATGSSDITIKDGALHSSVKQPESSFYVSGYRINTGNNNRTNAYKYCFNQNIKYQCRDDSGLSDDYFTVDGSGMLVDMEVDKYTTEVSSSILTIPETVYGRDVTSIGEHALDDLKASNTVSTNIVEIDVNEKCVTVHNNSLAVPNIKFVKFKSSDTSLNGSTVFDQNLDKSTFFLLGDAVMSDKAGDSCPLGYAMQYDYIFKGYGNYDGEQTSPYLTIKKVNGKRTLTAVSPTTSSSDEETKKPAEKLAISKMRIPSGVQEINDNMFEGDKKIEALKLEGLTKINDAEFKGCTALDNVAISSIGLTDMGEIPFEGCTALTAKGLSITDNPYFSSDEYGIIYGPESPTNLTSSTCIYEALENGVSPAAYYATPANVTTIKPRAFYNNNSINEFNTAYDRPTSYASNILVIPESCFEGAKALTTIFLGEGTGKVSSKAFAVDQSKEFPSLSSKASNVSYDNTGGTWYTAVKNKKYMLYGTVAKPTTEEERKQAYAKDATYREYDGHKDYLDYGGKAGTALIDVDLFEEGSDYNSPVTLTNKKDYLVTDVESGKQLTPTKDFSVSVNASKDIKDVTYGDGTLSFSLADGVKYADVTITFAGQGDYTNRVYKTITVKQGDTPGPGTKKVLTSVKYPSNPEGDIGIKHYMIPGIELTPGSDFLVLDSDGKMVDQSYYTPSGNKIIKDISIYDLPKLVSWVIKGDGVNATGEVTVQFNITKSDDDTEGDFDVFLPGIDDDAGFAEWTGGTIKPVPTVTTKEKPPKELKPDEDGTGDYKYSYPAENTVSGANNRDIGQRTGKVYITGKNAYEGKKATRTFAIRKSIPDYVTSDEAKKKITVSVTDGTYTNKTGEITANVELVDATYGEMVENTDYTVRLNKAKGNNATATITGIGNYFGTYTTKSFPLRVTDPSSSSTSSTSSSSSKSSSSSSKSSSSSSKSSSSSSGSSSSSSGSSSSGSGNKNSGTTVVNRNYYGTNGGTADELQDMLRAAHIDSINGGTADGYQVNITKSDAAEASFREALIRRYGSLDNIRYFSMDIDVKDENGNDIDTTGMSVTLTLPLPRSMEQYGTNNKIATVDSNGDLEDLNEQFSTLEGRPCVTFVAPHFSPYGFYVNTADLAIGTLDNTPKTGDPIHPKWFLSIGLAALSIFLFLKRDPKPQANPA